MSLLAIALLAAYTVASCVCARLVAGHFAWWFRMAQWRTRRAEFPSITPAMPPSAPNGEQWAAAICLALLVALFWPCVLVLRLVNIERWAIGAEAAAIAEKRERRIAELERELDQELQATRRSA